MKEITSYVVLCNWLLPLSMFSRLILAFSCVSISFLLMAKHYSTGWISLPPFQRSFSHWGHITECFTYRHIHVHPHPQPGLGDSHSGRTLHCWYNAHSCRFLGFDIRQHLPRGEHKPSHNWVNLTFFLSVVTALYFQPFVFNFEICGKINVIINLF